MEKRTEKDAMYERMTTDTPDNNLEMLLNYAYAKDGEVYLRYADGRNDVPMALFIEQEAHAEGCKDVRREDIINGDACLECEYCILAILNAVATQAAEIRGRLMEFEDIGRSPTELKRMVEICNGKE